ncbi:MAG: S-methyl-5-thioribose-1-phosphate isomerase [Acidimicrobiales bacterium]
MSASSTPGIGGEADPLPPTVEWREGSVRLIDQRRLPEELTFIEAATVDELCEAISTLAVRGAPALGVAGAMGVALAASLGQDIQAAASRIVSTRPTAVNLQWGVQRALAASDPILEATVMAGEDVERNRRLGAVGAGLLAEGSRVLTHCNAGSLACVGYGTALGVIRAAHEAGQHPSVWVDETRPVLQGSRLTAWELDRLGIPATVVVDSAAGSLMANGEVDCVIVGADRIAANGDVANKVGTYSLAVLARHHRIPFYVAAPVSTIDLACASGADIPVEQRAGEELAWAGGRRVTPTGTAIANPAFDITPARLISAIVTEEGVAIRPYRNALARLLRSTT